MDTRGRGDGDRRQVNPEKNSFCCVHVMNTCGRGAGGRRQVNPNSFTVQSKAKKRRIAR